MYILENKEQKPANPLFKPLLKKTGCLVGLNLGCYVDNFFVLWLFS